MKKLVAGLVALILAAPAIPQSDPTINSGMPPERHMGEAVALVLFSNDVPSVCGKAPPPYRIIACAEVKGQRMVLPNPCNPIFAGEYFAKIACHEKGHLNGWPKEHGA